MSNLKVTSIEDLKAIAKGEVVELPGWVEGTPFVARLVRPSIQKLVADGTIPNSLLSTASEVFYGKSPNSKPDMKKIVEVQDLVVSKALVEPSVNDLEEADIELTDQQIVAIFNYTQQGIRALDNFREKPTDNEGNKSEPEVQA